MFSLENIYIPDNTVRETSVHFYSLSVSLLSPEGFFVNYASPSNDSRANTWLSRESLHWFPSFHLILEDELPFLTRKTRQTLIKFDSTVWLWVYKLERLNSRVATLQLSRMRGNPCTIALHHEISFERKVSEATASVFGHLLQKMITRYINGSREWQEIRSRSHASKKICLDNFSPAETSSFCQYYSSASFLTSVVYTYFS